MHISSSIYRKLHSNEPPTSEEVVVIQKGLSGSLENLQTLGNQISHLQVTLHNLSLEQDRIQAFLDDHARLLTPFRRLLPEILQEIFYHCLPTAHNAVMSVKDAPLLLGRVCSQWRQVSHTTPKLWASIHISALDVSPRNHRGTARRRAVSSWLSRSGVLPLSISLSTDISWEARRPDRTINAQIQPYFDVITQYSHRWKSFHLTLYDYDWSDFFTSFPPSDFPLLKVLHVDSDFQARRDRNSLDYSVLAGKIGILQAPCLHNLSWPAHLLHYVEARVEWKNITGLDLGTRPLPFRNITSILTKCPNLEVCSILVHTMDRDAAGASAPWQTARLVLPVLRTLSLMSRSTADSEATSFLEIISTPSLRHLSYEQALFVDWPDGVPRSSLGPEFISAFGSFLHRLTHPLEELTICTNPFSAKCALEILRLVPELKRLSLRGYLPGPWHSRTAPLPIELQGHLMDDLLLGRFIPSRSTVVSSGSVLPSFTGPEEDEAAEYQDAGARFPCLCPKLEVFECSDAMFSNRRVLEFLRSRTVQRHELRGVVHLRRASIALSPWRLSLHPEEGDLGNELRALEHETGLLVGLMQPPPIEPLYPPPPAFGSEPLWSTSVEGAPGSFGYFGF